MSVDWIEKVSGDNAIGKTDYEQQVVSDQAATPVGVQRSFFSAG
jgi:hypothetical protein